MSTWHVQMLSFDWLHVVDLAVTADAVASAAWLSMCSRLVAPYEIDLGVFA